MGTVSTTRQSSSCCNSWLTWRGSRQLICGQSPELHRHAAAVQPAVDRTQRTLSRHWASRIWQEKKIIRNRIKIDGDGPMNQYGDGSMPNSFWSWRLFPVLSNVKQDGKPYNSTRFLITCSRKTRDSQFYHKKCRRKEHGYTVNHNSTLQKPKCFSNNVV